MIVYMEKHHRKQVRELRLQLSMIKESAELSQGFLYIYMYVCIYIFIYIYIYMYIYI
jgi:hypothetical protein